MFRRLVAFVLITLSMFTVAATSTKDKTLDRVTLGKENVLLLRGEVNEGSVSKIIMALQVLPKKELFLFIDSPGGDILAGLKLIEAMKTYEGHITCVANTAISMAFVILQNCETRLVTPSSTLMQHEASYGLRNNSAPHNYSFVTFLQRALRRMDEVEATRLGMTYDAFKSHTILDWWMDGTDALNNHAADQFTQVTCTKALTETTFDQEVAVLFFTVKLTWSACPLILAPMKVSTVVPEKEKSRKEEADQKTKEYIQNLTNPDSNREGYSFFLKSIEQGQ